MTESRALVRIKVGLHARPAALFVQEALKHSCQVTLECAGRIADGRSILQVLALSVKYGQEILVRAEGDGEAEVVRSLAALVSAPADEDHDTPD